MAYAIFALSVVSAGVIGSFIPGVSAYSHEADYHYVPYAGDVWGA